MINLPIDADLESPHPDHHDPVNSVCRLVLIDLQRIAPHADRSRPQASFPAGYEWE
jgi:hypothetical protein